MANSKSKVKFNRQNPIRIPLLNSLEAASHSIWRFHNRIFFLFLKKNLKIRVEQQKLYHISYTWESKNQFGWNDK